MTGSGFDQPAGTTNRSGPTKEVWYYEQPLPEGRKQYTKTQPHAKQDFEHLPPEKLAEDILQKELCIAEIMREIQGLLERKP